MTDRIVHASHPSGEEVVRYDRRGHWMIELVPPSSYAPLGKRVSLAEAVQRALELDDGLGQVYLGLAGGTRFDNKYRIEKTRRKGLQ